MLEYRYDTQLLIEGARMSEEEIAKAISEIPGDSLLAVGDSDQDRRAGADELGIAEHDEAGEGHVVADRDKRQRALHAAQFHLVVFHAALSFPLTGRGTWPPHRRSCPGTGW